MISSSSTSVRTCSTCNYMYNGSSPHIPIILLRYWMSAVRKRFSQRPALPEIHLISPTALFCRNPSASRISDNPASRRGPSISSSSSRTDRSPWSGHTVAFPRKNRCAPCLWTRTSRTCSGTHRIARRNGRPVPIPVSSWVLPRIFRRVCPSGLRDCNRHRGNRSRTRSRRFRNRIPRNGSIPLHPSRNPLQSSMPLLSASLKAF